MRFYAAIAVVFFHGAAFYKSLGGQVPLNWIDSIGFAGVDIFFVISGFIIWLTSKKLAGGDDAWRFAVRRAARIYLTFFIFAAIEAARRYIFMPSSFERLDMVKSLLLLPQGNSTNLLPVSWTLSYELYFYLLFSIAIGIGGRRWIVLIGCIVAAFAAAHHLQWIGFMPRPQFTFNPHLLEFASGCLMGYAYERGWLKSPRLLIVAGVIGLIAVAAGNVLLYEGKLITGHLRLSRVLLLLPVATALVAGMACLKSTRPPGLQALLGDASYAIYLAHMPFFAIYRRLTVGTSWPPFVLEISMLLVVAAICTVSVLTLRYVERPVLGWIKRRLTPKRLSTA